MLRRAMMAGNTAPVGGYKKWRINVTAIDGGAAVSLGELQFRKNVGVSETPSGGTASASSVYSSGHEAIRALDGSGPDYIWAAAAGPPQWIAYEFPSGREVVEVAIQSRSDGGTYGQTPSAFSVQYYDEATSSWVESWSVSGSTGWTASSWRYFAKP